MRNPRASKPTARDVRRAAAALKRAEIPGNKKPGIAPGLLNSGAISNPYKAAGANLSQPTQRVMNNEILC